MQVVKHEIKSQLAKLLATEDLIVEHRKVSTAQFNVQTRVLTLPNWERASNNVYDSLVAHEVGHALYTPDREWFNEVKIPQSFVNIVEDVRIEKLMKRRYAGLAKTFYNGYNELNDNDFFEIENEDLDTFNIADRVNLHYKIGAWVDVPFSVSEKSIVGVIGNVETFDDTLSAAEALYNLCKKETEKKQQEQDINQEDVVLDSKDSGMDNTDSDVDDSDPDSVDDSSSNLESDIDIDYQSTSNSGGINASDLPDIEEPEIHTAQAFEDALKDLTNLNTDNKENIYVELPQVNLKNIIVPNSVVHARINFHWQEEEKRWTDNKGDYLLHEGCYDIPDNEYSKFKKNAQKEVNYLVKEFECKKSASAYARSTTARTGVLDTTKLHTYKYNEDLFKKINVVPDGKNHGLVFILDWSGSMNQVMSDTIKQLYNLLWFCKKVNIPFEVYAFTNDYPREEIMTPSYEKKEGLAFIEGTFSLLNLFSSKLRSKELEIQMKNIFRISCSFNREIWTYYSIPLGMNLSGTPLNETLVALHQIIPQFQKETGTEKVQCIILTDGEGSPLKYSKKFQRHWESEDYMGSSYINENCIIRNRKTGYTYSCAGLGHWADVSDLLLKDLRQSFPHTNFIGIRILSNRDASQFIRRYAGYVDDSYHQINSRWKKEKSFAIKNSGYHTYFGLSSSSLSNDDEFDVQQDATKAQIKRAFVKSLKSKKMNKKVLGEFIELVA